MEGNMNYITDIDILDESKECFLTFAEEVLTDRAIPSAEDGLLSSQRKILWTMEDYLKMDSKSKTKKSNAVIGSTLMTSYFHGDQACYGVLCKMSQAFLMRYPLVDGQGSLGTQEANNVWASSRYTEAKPSIYTDLMMLDYGKNVVPTKETYNGEFQEPVFLPGLFPNALCNGRQAIGVSMSHSSPSHNLTEVCNGIIAFIKNHDITLDEMMEYIKGPDFPLGNVIINAKDIKEAFRTGKTNVSLKVRGDYEIDRQKITFTSIPYRTYRNKIKEQIGANADELNEYIEDFDDESGVGKNKLVFHIKKDVNPEKAVNKLFALTDLQTTVSYNMNFIVNGTPKLCSLLDLIKAYYIHQTNVLMNTATFDKDKAEKRKHVLEGLLIAIKDIDTAIILIKESYTREEAKEKLIARFGITDTQADAILDMKLARLTKLNKDDLLKELEAKEKIIVECNEILTNESYRDMTLIEKVTKLRDKYGDARRTKLLNIEIPKVEKEIEAVIPEDVVVIFSQSGDIKRIPRKSFRVQRKNGKGVKSEDDAILATISTNTVDTLMLFTSKGRMFRLVVDKVPTGTNVSKGVKVNTLIDLEADERVIALTSLYRDSNAKYVVFFTKNGMIKKTKLEEYMQLKKNTGIIAIKLKEGDSLANVTFLNEEEVIVITKNGMAIHFPTDDISPIGRVTAGVRSMKLGPDDEVLIGLPIHKKTDNLAIFTERGSGKKISLEEVPFQLRGGKGVAVSSTFIAGAAMIDNNDDVLLVGLPNSICVSATDIPLMARTSLGNSMIKNSKITSVVKL